MMLPRRARGWGGSILRPTHLFQSEVPPENMLAVWRVNAAPSAAGEKIQAGGVELIRNVAVKACQGIANSKMTDYLVLAARNINF